jgi:PAS domain S-box-containing protein
MIEPNLARDETRRLTALYELKLLDTPSEERFDRLTRLALRLFDVPIALVSLVDRDRQWFKSCQGLAVRETPRSISFCTHTIESDHAMVIEDALLDPRFVNNPLVTGEPHIRFYAGEPLHAADGSRVGTLCLIDSRPRQFDEKDRAALRDLSQCVQVELNAIELITAVKAHHQAEAARREIEERFNGFMENSPLYAWVTDKEGHLLYLNQSFSKSIGRPIEELVGRSAREFYSPELFEEYMATIRQVYKTGQSVNVIEARRSTGDVPGYLLTYKFPLETSEGERLIGGVGLDITEHKRTEQRMQILEKAIEATTSGVIITDATRPDNPVLFANSGFERLTGYSIKETLGQNCRFLQGDDRNQPALDVLRQSIEEHKECRVVLRNYRKDGSLFYNELLLGPVFNAQGELTHFVGIQNDLTQQKFAEEQLRQSEHRFRVLIENASEVVVIHDHRGMYRYVSPNTCHILGYSPEEMLKQNFKFLIHPKDLDHIEKVIRQTLKAPGIPHKVDTYRVRHANGQWRYFEASLTNLLSDPVIQGVVANCYDVTQRYIAEQELAAEKEQLAVTLQSIGDAVINIDTAGRIVLFNPAAELLTGYSSQEAVGKPLPEVFRVGNFNNLGANASSRQLQFTSEIPLHALAGNPKIMELDENAGLLTKRGTVRRIAGKLSFIHTPDQGQLSGMVLVVHDITEKAQLEAELIKAQKLESLGLLAGGIAHDFNNILTAVVGSLGLAKQEIMKGSSNFTEIKNILNEAESAAYRAKNLTGQLLTFSKGGVPVKKVVAMAPLLEETVRFALRGSKIRPDFHLSGELWPVEIDQGQFEQVIHNLVINADQATPQGGKLLIEARNLPKEQLETGLPVLPDRDYLQLRFQDEGIGIPPQLLDRIFDPYFTTKEKGSGLGLATVFSIIRRHEGFIQVESQPGQGTTFVIYLPAARQPDPAQPKLPADGSSNRNGVADEVSKSENLNQKRILVMDDELPIRRLLQKALSRQGYEVSTAAEGGAALKLYNIAQQSGQNFDLVIMDLTIPGGMGGKETIKQLRAIDAQVKVLVASGYSDDPLIAHYRDYGFSGTITKPFRLEELQQKLDELLK